MQDFDGNGTPDFSCRVIQLLEADPNSTLFFQNP